MKPMVKTSLMSIVCSCLAAGAVWLNMQHVRTGHAALPPMPVSADQVVALLKSASAGNVTVDKVLPDTKAGFTGVIAKDGQGERFVLWVNPQATAFAMMPKAFFPSQHDHTRS